MDLHLHLHLWSVDEDEFVIAKDADDVRAVLRDLKYYDPEHELEIAMWADERPFTLCRDNDEKSAETKTAREWCAERGRGYFCASV